MTNPPTKVIDVYKDMKDVTCSPDIWWDKLTELGTAALRDGEELIDGVTFFWYKDGVLSADNGIIDVAAFQTAIDAIDATAEGNKNAFGELRKERNLRLTETDWWAGSDHTITAAETKYRQDLRDLPANTSDPKNPTWPTKP